MQQDLYILTIWSGVEPVLTGPYKDKEERRTALKSLKKDYGINSSYFTLDAPKGAQVEIGQFE